MKIRIIIIILVMTDISSIVVLQCNDIKEISCSTKSSCCIISAVEGKCPHLYFLQAKASENHLRTSALSLTPRDNSALSGLSCKCIIILHQNYKFITSHMNRDHSCLITKRYTHQQCRTVWKMA